MTANIGSYAEWAQVVIAIGAVVLATFPISRFITSRFFTIRASCVPIDPVSTDRSTVWYIELRNKSRLFGGFIFDRAQGKPVTLDIGIGPLQTRVIGPPKDKELPALKVEEISPLAWLVLLMSGTVNYFGKTLQVWQYDSNTFI